MSGLMQIAEPGLSTAPHEERLAVGIDLGTTNSLVASVVSGEATVLRDEKDRALFPSVVRFMKDGGFVAGWDALQAIAEDPKNTVSSAKRLIGRELDDIKAGVALPYDFQAAKGLIKIQTVAGEKTPVEVSAAILSTLKERAEVQLGGELTGAVITVPAYFDDAQRQATKDAAKVAGLHVLRLLNEPTAAALAYGLDNGAEGLYLIYDLGGGTFDVSLLKLSRGVFEVVATGGDSALGGDDFDAAIVEAALKEKAIVLSSLNAKEKREALLAARRAREDLTVNEAAMFTFEKAHLTLTRDAFKELVTPLVERTLATLTDVLKSAKAAKETIKGIVLVGGSTRMPVIREAVKTYFGREPLTDIDPDKVVAIGAALQANQLAGNVAPGEDWLLLDVTPLSLGIETMGGLVEKIIPRNSAVPVAMAQDFTTFKDNQTALAVHVVQGEREIVDACRSLARFTLRGIPPMAAGVARIRVTYQIDADGLLSVSARETRTGVEASIQVKPSYGLSDEEIVRMLQEGNAASGRDKDERKLREEVVEARRLILATQSALNEDGDLLTIEEKTDLQRRMDILATLLKGKDADAIHKESEVFIAATGDFAARRMDRSIRRALAGQTVDSLKGQEDA